MKSLFIDRLRSKATQQIKYGQVQINGVWQELELTRCVASCTRNGLTKLMVWSNSQCIERCSTSHFLLNFNGRGGLGRWFVKISHYLNRWFKLYDITYSLCQKPLKCSHGVFYGFKSNTCCVNVCLEIGTNKLKAFDHLIQYMTHTFST